MELTVYIYKNKSKSPELIEFRCPRCGRIVFKHNSNKMLLSNGFGASYKELTPADTYSDGVPVYVEYKCHSCRSVYRILFQ